MTTPATFPSVSTKLALPFLYPAQAQKEFFLNEALARLDAAVHPAVSGESATPPTSPARGECWLVSADATGVFKGHDGEIAFHDGDQWSFIKPSAGMTMYDRSANLLRSFSTRWSIPVIITAPTDGEVVDTEARATIVALLQALAGLSAIKHG